MDQAEAIVTLQLYRLSNTDIAILEEEAENLKNKIAACEAILSDEEKLKSVMKTELRDIKKNYAEARKTEIKDEITEIKVINQVMKIRRLNQGILYVICIK